jgi:hypothetical protein
MDISFPEMLKVVDYLNNIANSTQNKNLFDAIEKVKTIFNYEIHKNNRLSDTYKYPYFELDSDNFRFIK